MNSPLFAVGIEEVITWVVIFLFIIVPAIGQLLSKMGKPQPPPAGRRPQRPAPKDLAEEIEVFMRGEAGKRGGRRPPAPQRPRVPQRPDPQRPAPQRPAPIVQPVEAEVVAAAPLGQKVKDQVRQYLDSEEFSRRAGALGGDFAKAKEELARHIRQEFDRKLGQLQSTAGGGPLRGSVGGPESIFRGPKGKPPPTLAAGWAAMLTNVDSARQAIVLSEIINRPEQRWT